jgi:hypothetical protein
MVTGMQRLGDRGEKGAHTVMHKLRAKLLPMRRDEDSVRGSFLSAKESI